MLSLGLCVPSASAGSAAARTIKFKPYTFGYVRDGFLGAARPRNRILIGRTPEQALRWDKSIRHYLTTAPQYADFTKDALIGVFLLARPSLDLQGVAVTSLVVSSGTLLVKLVVSPYPPFLCGPGVDSPTECFGRPGAPTPRYHAFTIVSVARAAVAHVRRVVVTQEVYDPNPLMVHVPYLPG